jgi:hypothetical protein
VKSLATSYVSLQYLKELVVLSCVVVKILKPWCTHLSRCVVEVSAAVWLERKVGVVRTELCTREVG